MNPQLGFLAMSGVDVQVKGVHGDTVRSVKKILLEVITNDLKQDLSAAKY